MSQDHNTNFGYNVNDSVVNPRADAQATISQYIRGDLLNRIAADGEPPAALTLAALARHYAVSFTPVREAIRGLVAEGVLVKQDNGRVRVDLERARYLGSQEAGVVAGPHLRSRRVEEALAEEVIGRSLRGEADYLREEATAARLGVGRTAIRQAFGRLAGRGLVVHVPRCGWHVRPFDERDMDAYLELREALEHKALDLARPHLLPTDLKRMLDAKHPVGERGASEQRHPRVSHREGRQSLHSRLLRAPRRLLHLDLRFRRPRDPPRGPDGPPAPGHPAGDDRRRLAPGSTRAFGPHPRPEADHQGIDGADRGRGSVS